MDYVRLMQNITSSPSGGLSAECLATYPVRDRPPALPSNITGDRSPFTRDYPPTLDCNIIGDRPPFTRDYPPILPSNITGDRPSLYLGTRDHPPSLLILQGIALPVQGITLRLSQSPFLVLGCASVALLTPQVTAGSPYRRGWSTLKSSPWATAGGKSGLKSAPTRNHARSQAGEQWHRTGLHNPGAAENDSRGKIFVRARTGCYGSRGTGAVSVHPLSIERTHELILVSGGGK